jgi:hypothetical protein
MWPTGDRWIGEALALAEQSAVDIATDAATVVTAIGREAAEAPAP